MGGGEPFDGYLEFLNVTVPAGATLADTTFGSSAIKKYADTSVDVGLNAGCVVVDRVLAKDDLYTLYGSREAVSRITAYSEECGKDALKDESLLASCTEYPAYLSLFAGFHQPLYALPDADDTRDSYTNGKPLKATGVIEDANGNFWYRVVQGLSTRYIPADSVLFSATRYDDITIHNYNYPTAKAYGKAFSVYGIVAKTYNRLSSVKATITSPGGTEKVIEITDILASYSLNASDGWTAYKYSLDNKLPFSKLAPGTHNYKLCATVDNYYVSCGELKCESKEIELINRDFIVQATVTFDAGDGTVEPATALTNKDGKLDELPTPVLGGFHSETWALEDGTPVTLDTVFTANTTIYASWAEGNPTPTPTPSIKPTPSCRPTCTPRGTDAPSVTETAAPTAAVTEAAAMPLSALFSPQTGDNASIIFWIALIVLSGAVIVTTLKNRKK